MIYKAVNEVTEKAVNEVRAVNELTDRAMN